ncbi:MAG: hypothetical protein ABJR46_16255 [Tateyamaria sp.]|uniref:hypothetical protein n=1 Tax=Tateyamaria sp. TaxID=1929288 RepID=UPI00329EACBB
MVHIDENFVTRPLSRGLDFKELFQDAISARAGLTLGGTVDTSSEWTPSLLAEALAEADPKGRGVDVRTVQNWFQDNDRGISSENIVCLARVFGRGDPDAIAMWRTELRAGNKLLASKRRARRKSTRSTTSVENATDPQTSTKRAQASQYGQNSIARLSERIFTSSDGFSISILVWAGFFMLCLAAFIAKNHDITYPAGPGLDKQVGFFWSLSWSIECLLLYPASFLLIANLVTFWKRESQRAVQSEGEKSTWNDLIDSLRFPFWVAASVAFVLVFIVQWGGVYLVGLMQTGAPELIDWLLVAHVRPDVITMSEALFVSLLAFSYSGLVYCFYFVGLLLLFAVTEDFHRRATSPDPDFETSFLERAGGKLQRCIYFSTVIGIFIAVAIQLNAIYLKSDGETSLSWLANDFAAMLDPDAKSWAFLEQSSVSSLTSSILLLLHLALFGVCTIKVRSGLRACRTRNRRSGRLNAVTSREREPIDHDTLVRQVCILGLLCLTFGSIGKFVGFTVFLFASLLITVASIFWSQRGSCSCLIREK